MDSVADPGCLSRIPDPTFFQPGSRIRIKEFKYFNPKKWFLSSRKYDPGCSSRIPDPDADFLPIPDPGSRGQKGTWSRIWIRNTVDGQGRWTAPPPFLWGAPAAGMFWQRREQAQWPGPAAGRPLQAYLHVPHTQNYDSDYRYASDY